MTRRIALAALVTLILAATLSGCGALKFWDFHSAPDLDPIANPLPALHDLSVTPVETPAPYSSPEWTTKLEQALLKVEGITRIQRVDTPRTEIGGGRDKLPRLEDGSQGLLDVRVLSFDPYYPPSAHVEVYFYVTRQAQETAQDVIGLEKHGAPPRATDTGRRTPWIRFEKVFRVTDPEVADNLRDYAECQGDWDRGMSNEERVARISDRFMDFVFYETLKLCFGQIRAKEVESDGFLRKLLVGAPQ